MALDFVKNRVILMGRAKVELHTGRTDVDFFPDVLAHVIDVDAAGYRLHGEGERVAQPVSQR